MDLIFFLGRLVFAAVIVITALTTHFGRQGVAYARAYGLPAPQILAPLLGGLMSVAAIMLVLGVWADLAALALMLLTLATALLLHPFWREQDEQTSARQLINFTKNIGLAAGALFVFYAYNQLQEAIGLNLTDPLFGRW